MKITFLGTGPSGRIPRPNCKRYVCREAEKPNSKSARLQTSTFFESKNFNVLIDAGQDFKKQSKLIKNKNINAVFLTHGHIDAIGGLKELYKFSEEKKLPVIYTEKIVRQVLIQESFWADFPFKEIQPYKKMAFKGFSVVPFRVEHSFNPRFPTLGYLFEINKKRIAYASDFKKMPEKSKKLVKKADLAILDCAAYKKPIPTHLSFPEVSELIRELAFKKVYLTQVGIAWPHYELAQKVVSKQFPNVFLAYDGLSIGVA